MLLAGRNVLDIVLIAGQVVKGLLTDRFTIAAEGVAADVGVSRAHWT
jgi:hypothetical protein